MKQKKAAKVFAIFALLGIILSVVGTGILVLTSSNQHSTTTISPEQLQEIINQSSTQNSESSSGATINISPEQLQEIIDQPNTQNQEASSGSIDQ